MSLTWPALQFQTPDAGVALVRAGTTYTLKRNIGQGRTEDIDLVANTTDGATLHVLRGHRIVAAGPVTTTLLATSSTAVYEYALKEDGVDYVGNWHGNDAEQGLTFAVDGVAVTPADGSTTTGKTVRVVRTSVLTSRITGQPLAAVTCTYTMTGDGLDVEWAMVFSAVPAIDQMYVAMLPVEPALSRCRSLGNAAVDLTANDNSMKNSAQAQTGTLWEPAGNHGVFLHLHDLAAVFNWTQTDGKNLWFEDNATRKKLYVGHAKQTAAVGDEWRSHFRIGADFFDGGAQATLNR